MKHSKHFITVLIICLLSLSRLAGADRCDCDTDVRNKVDSYDALLSLTPSQKAAAENRNTFYGIPEAPSTASHEHLLDQQDYLIWYDDDLRIPLWVSYELSKTDLQPHRERLECFRKDPRLDDNAAGTCNDYDEPIFDRGHLVPNADMERSEAAMINTYMFSNMTPQYKHFNRGVWEKLEGMVRNWAKLKGKVYVISGAVFDKNNDGKQDSDSEVERVKPGGRVAIPSHFYKIIIYPKLGGQADTIAILLPNNDAIHLNAEYQDMLTTNITTIKRIESLTGFTFFPKLSPSKRNKLENDKASALWSIK
jgi:DNA/RNA endonuclease G (NUC1)